MSEKQWGNSWFSDYIASDWDRLLRPLGPFRAYLEIGVCEGASMLYALENLLNGKDPDSFAIGVDPWKPKRPKLAEAAGEQRRRAFHNLAPYLDGTRRPKLTIRQGESYAVFVRAIANHGFTLPAFDLIYIDGDHSARGALLDLLLAWDFLESGGVLILDDIHRRAHRGRPLVREALHAFELTHGNLVDVVFETHRQKAWRKR